jgi:hypothetical protein
MVSPVLDISPKILPPFGKLRARRLENERYCSCGQPSEREEVSMFGWGKRWSVSRAAISNPYFAMMAMDMNFKEVP